MAELNIGAAKVDITPVTSCWMAGYGNRYENGPMSSGAYDRLHARAFVAEGEGGLAALVSCDLCFLDPDTVNDVRAIVGGPLGIPPERLMAVATHTHAGPVTEYPHPNAPKTNLEWLDALAHKMAEAVFLAAMRRRPARLGVVRGESRIAMNRQQTFEDGTVSLGAAPEKPADTAVIAAVIDSGEGQPIARLIHYNCHNTTLGPKNSLFSADYAGRAMSAVEAQIGGGVVCPFVNGGAGNADPYYRVLEDAADPRVQEVADTFTRDVLKTLASEPAFGADGRVAGGFHDIALPRKLAGIEAGLGRFKRIRAQALRIGDLVVVGSPNEIVCEIAMNIKKRSPAANTLVAGYCANAIGPWHPRRDGVGGYIPAAAHYDFGGYEVQVSPYSREAEAVFTREMVKLARTIMGRRKV
jgi:hypothetical protein